MTLSENFAVEWGGKGEASKRRKPDERNHDTDLWGKTDGQGWSQWQSRKHGILTLSGRKLRVALQRKKQSNL